jgi:hypothetical protein
MANTRDYSTGPIPIKGVYKPQCKGDYITRGFYICMNCMKSVDSLNSDGHLFWCSEKCYQEFMNKQLTMLDPCTADENKWKAGSQSMRHQRKLWIKELTKCGCPKCKEKLLRNL